MPPTPGQLHLCIGFLERHDGPFLGLRDLVEHQIRPRFPTLAVAYHSYRDNLPAALASHPTRPLILLGHSYGASALVRAAARLPAVTIDHLILLDPVPRWAWGQFQWTCYRLSPNVQAATCLYNPFSLPKSSPIRGQCPTYRNIPVSASHARIPSHPDVQSHILAILARTLTTEPTASPTTSAPAESGSP